MFGSNVLEIAIGLIFVFILVSTICAAIREGIEAKLKTRAAYLEHGIRQLLMNSKGGTDLVKHLYSHPLINGLFNKPYEAGTNNDAPDLLAKGNNLPSYIPSKNFARALMDIAACGPQVDQEPLGNPSPIVDLQNIRKNIANIGNPNVQRVLLNAIDMAQGDLNQAQANIENWFNSSMDRVSGWYKRSTQWIIFWIGIAVAVLLNINTITIVNFISKNDTARQMIVEKAAALAKDTSIANKDYAVAQKQLEDLQLPIGYPLGFESIEIDAKQEFGFYNSFLGPLLGWLITALAATLGAPFWFDMLNKIMVIRSTVKPHEKSGEEDSEDRQAKPPKVVYVGGANAIPEPAARPNQHVHQESEIDSCSIGSSDVTPDDELPETKGGVA